MIKIAPRRAALCFWAALILAPYSAEAQSKAPPSRPGATKTIAIAAPVYRAELQKALADLKRKPLSAAAVGKIIKKLDVKYAVRRADGQTQAVSGNYWSNTGRILSAAKTVTPSQIRRAREALEEQIGALDDWMQTPNYQPADARKIVAGLAASGQIRVEPLWWQQAISNFKAALSRAWQAFVDWINGLFPRAAPLKTNSNGQWLWILFYGLVTAILALILWFLWRTFGGNLGRRGAKRAADLENEDAALLQLPPAELLSRAERFAAQGNFREALRHRYLSLLLDLDARGVWRYDARRTNWEHIAALGRSEIGRELVTPLAALTKRFDRVRYGGATCDDESWRGFDGDARAFENQAAPLQKLAARASETAKREVETAR